MTHNSDDFNLVNLQTLSSAVAKIDEVGGVDDLVEFENHYIYRHDLMAMYGVVAVYDSEKAVSRLEIGDDALLLASKVNDDAEVDWSEVGNEVIELLKAHIAADDDWHDIDLLPTDCITKNADVGVIKIRFDLDHCYRHRSERKLIRIGQLEIVPSQQSVQWKVAAYATVILEIGDSSNIDADVCAYITKGFHMQIVPDSNKELVFTILAK